MLLAQLKWVPNFVVLTNLFKWRWHDFLTNWVVLMAVFLTHGSIKKSYRLTDLRGDLQLALDLVISNDYVWTKTTYEWARIILWKESSLQSLNYGFKRMWLLKPNTTKNTKFQCKIHKCLKKMMTEIDYPVSYITWLKSMLFKLDLWAVYPNFVFQRLPVERLFLNFGVIALNFVVYTLLL